MCTSIGNHAVIAMAQLYQLFVIRGREKTKESGETRGITKCHVNFEDMHLVSHNTIVLRLL